MAEKCTLVSMDMRDERSKRIVFVSLCILNQNVRFPGIAVEAGACTELVRMLMKNGLGIEPLPCLERIGWGGVRRKIYFRYQPIMLRHADSFFSIFLRAFARLWVMQYGLICRREARKVARIIRDYIESGYTIEGIIAMNDSPTDGVTRTIDLVNAPKRFRDLGFSDDLLKTPEISTMKKLIQGLCQPGTGIFISKLRKELARKGLYVKIVGFDPWADTTSECRRIAQELGIKAG